MGMKERTAQRRKRMKVHRARDFKDAEQWDLDYWQSQTPEDRLSALVALHKDYMKIKAQKSSSPGTGEGDNA